MFNHACTKCGQTYQDADQDPYLCPACLQERKAIASKIDAEFSTRARPAPRTALQEYDEAPKFNGFMIVK